MKFAISAIYSYGPFGDKESALRVKNQVARIGAKVSPIRKTALGFSLTATIKYAANNQADRDRAVRQIKQNAPLAKVSISKR